jgi:hypothetical protein
MDGLVDEGGVVAPDQVGRSTAPCASRTPCASRPGCVGTAGCTPRAGCAGTAGWVGGRVHGPLASEMAASTSHT